MKLTKEVLAVIVEYQQLIRAKDTLEQRILFCKKEIEVNERRLCDVASKMNEIELRLAGKDAL